VTLAVATIAITGWSGGLTLLLLLLLLLHTVVSFSLFNNSPRSLVSKLMRGGLFAPY
jgi:hypothetical protein